MTTLLLDGALARAERELRHRVDGEVSCDAGTRAAYSTDSCRSQIHQLDSGGHEGHHLAELLAAHLEPPTEVRPPEGSNR